MSLECIPRGAITFKMHIESNNTRNQLVCQLRLHSNTADFAYISMMQMQNKRDLDHLHNEMSSKKLLLLEIYLRLTGAKIEGVNR